MSDLDKLIAAVEAGDLGVLSTTTLDPPSGYLTRDMARLCVHACDGSLDAALRLHEALLPGWEWCVDGIDALVQEPLIEGRIRQALPIYGAASGNPARAWLLAILRALKAKEGP